MNIADWPWETYRERLQKQARYLLTDTRVQARFDPEDLVQEVCARAAQHAAAADLPDDGARMAWLNEVLANLLYDRARYDRAEKRDVRKERQRIAGAVADSTVVWEPAAAGAPPSVELRRQESAEALRAAIARLDADLAAAVALRYFEGCKMEEIATRLNVNERTISRYLRKAEALLAAELAAFRSENPN
jgi:RNA polymerase sigma factor (sigma-70 family)